MNILEITTASTLLNTLVNTLLVNAPALFFAENTLANAPVKTLLETLVHTL